MKNGRKSRPANSREKQVRKSEKIEKTAEILLVDDEEIIITTTSLILKRYGYNVTTCSSGEDAVQKYKKRWKQTSLVILDIIMPGMNGLAVFNELKKINPEVRVLFCSGYGLDEEIQAVVDKGAAGFVQKPFRAQELTGEMKRMMGAGSNRSIYL